MSDVKHTPGPWHLKQTVQWHKEVYRTIEGTNRTVPVLANANLICAAPELLSALVGLADAYVALLLMKAEDPSRFKEPGSPYANALAAISKAQHGEKL